MRKLTQLSVRAQEDKTFVLHVEDDSGEALDFAVSAEQVDVIAEAMEEILAEHEEEAFAMDDGEIYQKPLG